MIHPPGTRLNAIYNKPIILVVMGVSGTGKSTLGKALAAQLGIPFIDGDDLHPRSNVDKMTMGQPLTDEDREPWLDSIRNTARTVAVQEIESTDSGGKQVRGVVVGCSALKKYYRDILRGTWRRTHETPSNERDSTSDSELAIDLRFPTYFVFIDGSRELLIERMEKRKGHFMKATMLDSQLADLEAPFGEKDVIVVSAADKTEDQVSIVRDNLTNIMEGTSGL